MKSIKVLLFNILKSFSALPDNLIQVKTLDFWRGLEKQLDEYRELLESIEAETGYFSSSQGEFSACQAGTLDNYLSVLYELRYGIKANSQAPLNYLRKTPSFIKDTGA